MESRVGTEDSHCVSSTKRPLFFRTLQNWSNERLKLKPMVFIFFDSKTIPVYLDYTLNCQLHCNVYYINWYLTQFQQKVFINLPNVENTSFKLEGYIYCMLYVIIIPNTNEYCIIKPYHYIQKKKSFRFEFTYIIIEEQLLESYYRCTISRKK